MRFIMIACAAPLATPSVAQTPPPPLTREQALTRSVSELADTAFRQIASEMREISRPTHVGIPLPDSRLQQLQFATAPRGFGYGLCEATVVWLSFRGPPRASPHGDVLPVSASDIRTQTVYKVVGDLAPPAWTDADRARLETRCSGEGRSLHQPLLTSSKEYSLVQRRAGSSPRGSNPRPDHQSGGCRIAPGAELRARRSVGNRVRRSTSGSEAASADRPDESDCG